VINGQTPTSQRGQNLEGRAHPETGYAEEAAAGKATEEIKAVNSLSLIDFSRLWRAAFAEIDRNFREL
jgi:hypothetical protein